MIKKVSILKYIIPGMLLFASCDDFLEEQSQDLIRPETVAHYQELLVGEGSFSDLMEKGWFVELMTDNLELYENPSDEVSMLPTEMKYGEGCYLWQKEIEDKLGSDGLYKHLYSNILVANTCLQDINDMHGSDGDRNILKGQASFVRAYGYFTLANLYSQAYNESDVDNDLCVAINLNAKPTLEKLKRNTIKEVWSLIKGDVENAVKCLGNADRMFSVYEINHRAALLLAARVALYMEDYDAVISYGEKFLKLNPALYDISEGISGDKAFLDPISNKEIVFNFGSKYEFDFIEESTGLNQFTFRVYNSTEQALISNYDEGDGRLLAFFDEPEISMWSPYFSKETWMPKKYDYYDKTGLRQAFRSAEIYLMMSEAYARMETPNNDKALSFLNSLRINRVRTKVVEEIDGETVEKMVFIPLQVSDFPTQEDLVNFIWDERRRELCFEEFHRWWDLRRIGQPSIKHNWKGGTEYVLEKNDPAYILNFPMAEREYNTLLEINPRPNRQAIN